MRYITSLFLTLLFALSCPSVLFSQPINNIINDVVMPPPEAASLGKYGDIPVSYFTGVPDISIPIHQLSSGSLKHSVSLSYHSSGIKVGEVASKVGLGWSLIAGGLISRTVQGIKDETRPGGYYFDGTDIPAFEDDPCEWGGYALEVGHGVIDGEPDIFSFNIEGYSGKFYFNSNQEPILVPQQDINIEPVFGNNSAAIDYLSGFIVTPPNGVKYYFGDGEIEISKYGGNSNPLVSSWYLKRISTPDDLYAIDFSYIDETYSYKNLPSCSTVSICPNGTPCYANLSEVFVDGKKLTTILTNTETVVFVHTDERQDLDPNPFNLQDHRAMKLDEIEIITGSFCKKFVLNQGYTTDDATFPHAATFGNANKRLILFDVTEKSCDESITTPGYHFTYNSLDQNAQMFLPNRVSKAIDHWGFYNGADDNNYQHVNNLNIPFSEASGGNGIGQYPGQSDRETNEFFMEMGVLEKIEYPTGGYTEFDFEANSYYATYEETNTTVIDHVSHGNNFPLCGNQVTTGQAVTFTQQDLADYDYFYEIGTSPFSCNCEITPGILTQMTIKVYDTTNPGAPPLALSVQGDCSGNSVVSSTDKLINLFPGIQANKPYIFEIDGTNCFATSLITLQESVMVTENKKVGGLRVESITSNSVSSGTVAKSFEYESSSIPSQSSGKLFYQPKYWTYNTLPSVSNDTQCDPNNPPEPNGGVYVFFDNSIVPLGTFEGYHIGYSRVVEQSSGNGRTVYNYLIENSEESEGFPVAPPLPRVQNGKLASNNIFHENGISLSQEVNTPLNDPYQFSDETDNYIKALSSSLGCGGQQIIYLNSYRTRTRPYRLESVEKILDGVSTVTDYEYDGLNRFLFPTAQEFTNSDGKTHRTEYTYVHDECGACTGTDVYSQMVQKNIIASPKKVVNKVDTEIASGTDKDYTLNFDGFPRLEKASNYEAEIGSSGSPTGGAWVLDGTVLGYDQGYPVGFQKLNWLPETYTWDDGKITSRTFDQYIWSYSYVPGTNLVQSITDIDGQTVNYKYDDLLRLDTVVARGGAVTTDYTYHYGSLQNEDYNYVKSRTLFEEVDPEASELSERTDYQYLDGLGRLMQTVKVSYSPLEKDVVQAVEYDGMGRLVSESIPVESSGAGGAYFEVPSGTASSTTQYEASPLNRIIAQSPAGAYPTTFEYSSNLDGEVLLKLGTSTYLANLLYKKTATDPNGNRTINFTDIKGRLILSRRADIDGLDANTYNQYDDKDRLTTVVPPDATVGDAGLIYQYQYDAADNMISKKIPDQAEMTMKYNNRDLMVFSQDGNLAAQSKWMLTKYDVYGRPTGTGFYVGANPDPDASLNFNPQLTQTDYGVTGIEKGKVKQSKSLNLIGGNWLQTEFFYDGFGRIDYQHSNNHVNGNTMADVVNFSYDNADNVINQVRTFNAFNDLLSITQSHSYDHSGRMIDTYHAIGNEEFHVSRNHYDVRDFVTLKTLHESENGNYLQYVNYTYNTAGWLTAINDVNTIDGQQIPDCDTIPTNCDEKCDYTVTTPCTQTTGNNTSANGIIGIYVNGGQLMDLDGYPYTCYYFMELETDIINWLDEHNVVYDSVSVTPNYSGNNDGIESLTITITQSSLVFNKVSTNRIYLPTPGSETDYYFKQTNCTVSTTPPVDICDLCRAKGYDCFKCPYSEMEPPCDVCNDLGILGCMACEGSGTSCDRCNDLGYQDCETCPLTVELINPLKLQIEYNVGQVSNGSPSLLKVTETSQYFLHDGTSKILSNTQNTISGSGDSLLSNMIHVMNIDLAGNLITQNNLAQVIAAIDTLVAAELNMAGIVAGASISNFQSSVGAVLESSWQGLSTFDGPVSENPSLNPDLFALQISYFQGNPTVNSPAQFNGNISGMTWATPNGGKQTFGFWYDDLDRLTKSEHRDLSSGDDIDKYGSSIVYDDLRGNIQSIIRNGVIDGCTYPDGTTGYDFSQIDNLSYAYFSGTNKLRNLAETSDKDHGFKGEGGSLDYDFNGNMTDIGYKQMTATYNHLNLPTSFTSTVSGSGIGIDYDGAGTKLRKTSIDAEEPDSSYVKDYLGGIEYKDGILEFISFPEGRITRKEDRYYYEYFIRDHLGNTRIVFSDKNKDGFLQPFNDSGGFPVSVDYSELLQESHYYSFGMEMEGPWDRSVSWPRNGYLYNGKELNDDFGLDWLDFGFRWYDPSIGRFTGVDPISDQYAFVTTYNYAENEPIANIDLWGLQARRSVTPRVSNMKVVHRRGQSVSVRTNPNYNANNPSALQPQFIETKERDGFSAIPPATISDPNSFVSDADMSNPVNQALENARQIAVAEYDNDGKVTEGSGDVNNNSNKSGNNGGAGGGDGGDGGDDGGDGKDNQGSGKGRGKNNRKPDSSASGAHSVFNDRGYTTFEENKHNPSGFQEVKRVDTKGGAHNGVGTPHVHEGGKVRPARKDEVPNN